MLYNDRKGRILTGIIFIIFLLSLSRYAVNGEPVSIACKEMEGRTAVYDGVELSWSVYGREEMNWRQGYYEVWFAFPLPEAAADSDGTLCFRMVQDDRERKWTVPVSELTIEEEKALCRFVPDMLQTGEATLYLTTEGIAEGELALGTCTDYYGFGELCVDGEGTGLCAAQRYYYHLINGEYILRLVCFAAVCLCMAALFFLLCRREENRAVCIGVFAVLTIQFFATVYVYESTVLLEPTYAEAVTNYLKFAREERFVDNLLITDAGYLPLMPRLIALFFVRLLRLPAAEALYLMQITACLLYSMMWAFFALWPFHRVLSLPARTISCILMMTLCFHLGTLYFINFTYVGAFAILLFLISDSGGWSRLSFALITAYGCLLCLSKGAYVILCPFMAVYLLFFYKSVEKRKRLYAVCLAAASLLQIVYSFSGLGTGADWIDKSGGVGTVGHFLRLPVKCLIDFAESLLFFLGEYVTNVSFLTAALALISGCLLLYGFVRKVFLPWLHKEKIGTIWTEIYAMALFAFASIAFYHLSVKEVPTSWKEMFRPAYEEIGDKYEIFQTAAILLMALLFLSVLRQRRPAWELPSLMALCLVCTLTIPRMQLTGIGRCSVSDNDRIYVGEINASWKDVKALISRSNFFVPVQPSFWGYSKNVMFYQTGTDVYFEETSGQILPMLEEEMIDSYTMQQPVVKLLEVMINKPERITKTDYYMTLLDAEGNILADVAQYNTCRGAKLLFVLEEPVADVETIYFHDTDGNTVFIDNYIGLVESW